MQKKKLTKESSVDWTLDLIRSSVRIMPRPIICSTQQIITLSMSENLTLRRLITLVSWLPRSIHLSFEDKSRPIYANTIFKMQYLYLWPCYDYLNKYKSHAIRHQLFGFSFFSWLEWTFLKIAYSQIHQSFY